MCRWGYCFGGAYPLPRTYHYSDDAIRDIGRIHRMILSRLDLKPGMRIADVGAGQGLLTIPIAQRVGPSGLVYATDIDEASLDRLRLAAGEAATAGPTSRMEIRLVKKPRDTALDEVPLGSLDRVLMINVFGFGNPHDRRETVAFLREFRDLLRVRGQLVYHQDWLREGNEYDREEIIALFESAGFPRAGVLEVPMPSHMPEETYTYDSGPRFPPVPLKRGYIFIFQK
jgi:cyclopropane fatty-acyl-phospholipid synthase-like methyltransferase